MVHDDVKDLLNKVNEFLAQKTEDDIEAGIRRFHADSQEYAKELEKILL